MGEPEIRTEVVTDWEIEGGLYKKSCILLLPYLINYETATH